MMPYAEGDEVEALVGLDWLPVTVVEAYNGSDGQPRLVVRLPGGDTFGVLASNVRPVGSSNPAGTMVVLTRPDGTAGLLPIADLTALAGYVDQRDARPRQNEPGA